MRELFIALHFLIVPVAVIAQQDKWALGGTVGFNCARIQVTSPAAATKVSTIQPTPAFGMFFRTALGTGERMLYALEFRAGYETCGANRELFYERAVDEWVRINDRYSTVPLSVLAYLSPGSGGKLWLGAGLKAQYVAGSKVRINSDFPAGAQGPVLEPEIKKLFPSVSAEVMWSAQLADIAITGCYGAGPLIADQGIRVTPMSVAITVKKRLSLGTE